MKFKIEKPCHENWNEMNSVSGGRFCDLCFKKVFDLTEKSDTEIDHILTEEANICVRIKQSPKFSLSKNFACSFSVASILVASVLPNSFYAQKAKRDTIERAEIMGVILIANLDADSFYHETTYKKINGWVKSNKSERESQAEINLVSLSNLYRIQTNNQGNFNFKISDDEYGKRLIFISKRKEEPNRIYFNETPSYDFDKVNLYLDEEKSYLLDDKNIARKETYYFDGDEVSYSEFTSIIADSKNVEYFYIPAKFSNMLHRTNIKTGIYLAFSKE